MIGGDATPLRFLSYSEGLSGNAASRTIGKRYRIVYGEIARHLAVSHLPVAAVVVSCGQFSTPARTWPVGVHVTPVDVPIR